MTNTNPTIAKQLSDFAVTFTATHPTEAVDGEYYDLPGETMYIKATLKLPEKSRVEVNTISDGAPQSFEWKNEITISDKPSGVFIHVLVRRDESVVETYGKTILDVSPTRSLEIMSTLEQLTRPA